MELRVINKTSLKFGCFVDLQITKDFLTMAVEQQAASSPDVIM